ncbi:L-threonylcarbamoyladenylate synthase [Rhodobacteraceae bacterium DSL-40]|uniref:L-threonylcarbamoyladenylate synthase n=1 Tax=Amaricoccus sp. B4 TaxID=3368557 RepID=UPI000DADD56B
MTQDPHSKNTVILSDSPRGLRAAAALLHAGEQVAFPTETVYGLGADARNPRAVAGIFAAKGRPAFNPLIVHVADVEAARALAEFGDDARILATTFWPGPLTLVLPRRPEAGLADLATAGLETVGIRVPAHPLARRLLIAFGGPVAAPSANPSGRVSPTSAAHVLEGLRGRIAAVVDGGTCPVGVESTIVGFDGGRPILLRPGGIPVAALSEALGREIGRPVTTGIIAPGQMTSHYAPRAQLRLEASGPGPDELWLGFGPVESLRPGLNLSPSGDLAEAAANLFAHLREIDAMATKSGVKCVAVAAIPEKGLGEAINDRLRRAAAPRPAG